MESFMVVKSFTLLTYFMYGKEKQEIEENFTIAPPQSCFVTVSVFVGISVDVPYVEGSRTGSECVQCPLTPAVRTTFQPTRLFLHSKATGNTGVEEDSEELVPERRASPHSRRSPSCLCCGDGEGDRKDMKLGASGLWLRLWVFVSPRSQEAFFPFNIQTSQASITGFIELLARECTIDWLMKIMNKVSNKEERCCCCCCCCVVRTEFADVGEYYCKKYPNV